MTRAVASLRAVFLWCLPTYVVSVIALALACAHHSIPFHLELALSEAFMGVMFLLPIATIVAAFKTISVPLRTADNRLHVGTPVAAWCLVAVALALNVFFYMAIERALR